MRIGVPAEVKVHEYRVALTPAGVREATDAGHHVLVEAGAGLGSSISDEEFARAGAEMVADADDVWAGADLLLKVKEPIEEEYGRLRRDQVLFTYLHLAASAPCTEALIASGTTAIAYETVQTSQGALPLLAPMSEVAGRLAAQVGAYHLHAPEGRGVLMGGVPGVHGADVVVLGGGVSGSNAARVALGMGARVSLLDIDVDRLRQLDVEFDGRVQTVASNRYQVEGAIAAADLVVGAVLVPGARAPHLVTREMVAGMRPGSVLVDVAIDQGGCFEDSHPTTHVDPTFTVEESVFYCVANMPGAVPHTATYALTNVTLPYVLALAQDGWRAALQEDPALRHGLNVHDGAVTNAGVAEAHGLDVVVLEEVLD